MIQLAKRFNFLVLVSLLGLTLATSASAEPEGMPALGSPGTGSSGGAQVGTVAEFPRDISVQGEATMFSAPDTLRITAVVETLGATTTDAQKNLDSTIAKLTAQLSAAAPGKITVSSRGTTFSDAGAKARGVSPNTQVTARGFVGLESSELSLAAKLVDTALAAGATSVPDIDFVVRKNEELKLRAVNEATAKARRQAEAIASSLGVKLGKVLSATVTEEPLGAILRNNRQLGGSAVNQYVDEEIRIFVALRFEVG